MPAPETMAGKRIGYDGASVLQMQRRVFTGRDADRSGSSGLSVRERGAKAPLYPGCRPSAQSNPRTSPRLDRRTPAFSTKTGLARSCWPWSFPKVEPASEFHGHQTEQPRSALWSTETPGPSPSAGLFRSLLRLVKPDKAARQTLPNPGKPHPSGPARQDTG